MVIDRISAGLVTLYLSLLCARQVCLSRRTLWLIAELGSLMVRGSGTDDGAEDERKRTRRLSRAVYDICTISLCASAACGPQVARTCDPLLVDCRRLVRLIGRPRDEEASAGARVRRLVPHGSAGCTAEPPNACAQGR